jgi:hypothetical protein
MLRCTNFVTFARRKGFYTAGSSRVFYIHKSLRFTRRCSFASFGNVSIRNGDSFQRSILCSLFIKDKPSDNCHLSFPSR